MILFFFFFLVVIGVAIWFSARLRDLERTVLRLMREVEELQSPRRPEPRATVTAPSMPSPRAVAEAPPQAQPIPSSTSPAVETPATAPPAPPIPTETPSPSAPLSPPPRIDWEQFMGVKGFAWIGGLALFLGIGFFVKYSFDNNLIPPELRVALGFLAGLGLLAGGAALLRRGYLVLSQTLSATGIVVLYAVTFACRAVYHFEFFGMVPTFVLMALITATAFLLAVRQNALVVAVLGMLAGFLTPILLSTGQDNPFGLFSYIAVLDMGLILVAVHRGWKFLSAAAAVATVLMQIGWAAEFFTAGGYFQENRIFIVLGILLGFNLLFLGANAIAERRSRLDWWLAGGNLALAGTALGFSAYFLDFQSITNRPALLFGFVFVIDLIVTALAWLKPRVIVAQPITGFVVFALLSLWTIFDLQNAFLNTALALYFAFAVFHTLVPALLTRLQPEAGQFPGWTQIFPPLAILLVFGPILKLTNLSILLWPFVLILDFLAIALAVISRRLLPVLAMLCLTMAATGALILTIPTDLTGLSTSLVLIGLFAVFFVMAGVWLIQRFDPAARSGGLHLAGDATSPEAVAALLPFTSVLLPFLLLMMVTLRLRLSTPSPVFGIALLLVVLLLGVTRLFLMDSMPLAGLIGLFALESTWHFSRFDPVDPLPTLIWYLVFYGIFAVYPFVFVRPFANRSGVWVSAALAAPAQFLLIYRLVNASWPNSVMGLLPAAFSLPALASLYSIIKKIPGGSAARTTRIAWFGGVALLFITLIFPIQFNREWITIGWGLEGAALVWLFRRVPHPGLRLTGVTLLVLAFLRLAVNPAVLDYHPRSAMPIFNWYLYTYAIVAGALFTGARLLTPPENRLISINAQAVLASLGTLLSFLLLNIEIADYFSPPGSTLTFQFSGNFARDMTYSIAWALFALGLLVYGIWKVTPSVRYAAMALLSITLLKLFFHDLASLAQPYRIVAFIAVAVIAMLASFAYQRFFTAGLNRTEARK